MPRPRIIHKDAAFGKKKGYFASPAAINAWLEAQGVQVHGPRIIRVDGREVYSAHADARPFQTRQVHSFFPALNDWREVVWLVVGACAGTALGSFVFAPLFGADQSSMKWIAYVCGTTGSLVLPGFIRRWREA